MLKKAQINKRQNSLKLTVILAFLAAISIVAGKYLAIRGGNIMRFSLENMPIIFAGMAFGPWAGLAVGVVADLVGCVMVGYEINPIVTLGAAAIGLISGFMPMILRKTKLHRALVTAITVAIAHFVGSAVIKTLGLAVFYTMPMEILFLWRLLNYLIVGALDGVVVYVLMKNKEIAKQINLLKGEGK